MSEIPDGIHAGTSREDYERIEAVNYSTLKHFARSPAHARAAMLHPPAASPAMDLGTAVHARLLEPERFAQAFVKRPKFDRRTTAGKLGWQAFEDENRGKEIIDPDDMYVVDQLAESASRCEHSSQLLGSPGKTEVAVVWTDRRTGLRCKALVDRITSVAGWTVAVDVKTTRDAEKLAFIRAVATFQYHVQAAFYLDGLDAIQPRQRRFVWLAAETKPPYCTALYGPSVNMLRVGRALYETYLDDYAKARTTNQWPGYTSEVVEINLPKWATPEEMPDGTD